MRGSSQPPPKMRPFKACSPASAACADPKVRMALATGTPPTKLGRLKTSTSMQAGASDCTCKAEQAFGKFPSHSWVPGGAPPAAAIVPKWLQAAQE